MSIWSAFYNSSQAMTVQSHSLGVIGQNVANVNSTGYKKAEDLFRTMISDVTTTNNFLGVAQSTRTLVDMQGSVVASEDWKDVSLNGKGFFILNSAMDGSGQTCFTRNGAFSLTSTGNGTGVLTDGNGHYLMGWQTTGDTTGSGTSLTGLSALGYTLGSTLAGVATTTASVQANIPSNATTTQSISIPVYDSSFASQTLNANFEPQGSNSWLLSFSSPDGTVSSPAAPITVTFDGNGQMTTPTDPISVGVSWNGQASTISVDLSNVSAYASSTIEMGNIVQDGHPSGELDKVAFDTSGNLVGTYSNGYIQKLGTIAVGSFIAPDALESKSGTLFTQTEAAGDLTVGNVDSYGSQTALVPGALESSTVTLEGEFTRMITTQKAYESASKVFMTSNEMIQTIRDLVK